MNSYIGLAVACPDYFTHKTPAATLEKPKQEPPSQATLANTATAKADVAQGKA